MKIEIDNDRSEICNFHDHFEKYYSERCIGFKDRAEFYGLMIELWCDWYDYHAEIVDEHFKMRGEIENAQDKIQSIATSLDVVLDKIKFRCVP